VKWATALVSLSAIAYAATGWYVVGGDEKAVVRRFGRRVPDLRGSGMHYDWPWPWSRVDRVNFAAVRTLVIGNDPSAELLPATPPRPVAYLTGDKNLLLLRASVQYRLAEEQVEAFLFERADAVEQLRLLAEGALTELASQCGVDFLHTFGVAEANQRLTMHLRQTVEEAGLGLSVEQVTLERVEPPARVQAEFLEVANARADAARAVHEARTIAEQRVAAAAAEADRLRQQAEQQRQTQLAEARGAASRFERLAAQLADDAQRTGRPYADVRAAAMLRMTQDTLREVLGTAARRMIVDAQEPIDLYLPGSAVSPP